MTVKRFHCFLAIGLASALSATASAQNAVGSGVTPSADQSTQQAANGRWYRDGARGWFWYEDPPEAIEDPDPVALMPAVGVVPADPIAELETLQAHVERAKALAVLHPTETHIRQWMELNAAVQRRATLFADMTQRVVWSTPSLDQSLVRPHSPEGLKAWTAARTESRTAALRDIAQSYGLFFVFSSDCPYCIQIAPFLKRFARTYDFKLIPISIDGGTLPEFPNARYEPSIKARLGVDVTPAIFLVDPGAGHIQPIAYGVISLSELESRIVRLFKMTPGQMTYSVYDTGAGTP